MGLFSILLLLFLFLGGCASNTGSWTQNDSEDINTYYPLFTVAGRTIGWSPGKFIKERSKAREKWREDAARSQQELNRELQVMEQTRLLREMNSKIRAQTPLYRSRDY